jgi:hypothetical protein
MTPTMDLEAPPAVKTGALGRLFRRESKELDHLQGGVEPSGYRVLVRIPRLEAQMKHWANLVRPESTRQLEEFAQVTAQVLAIGPLAYTGRKFGWKWWRRAWCKPGDFILMRAYSGTRFIIPSESGENVTYALINDDTVQGVVRGDPERIERA